MNTTVLSATIMQLHLLQGPAAVFEEDSHCRRPRFCSETPFFRRPADAKVSDPPPLRFPDNQTLDSIKRVACVLGFAFCCYLRVASECGSRGNSAGGLERFVDECARTGIGGSRGIS